MTRIPPVTVRLSLAELRALFVLAGRHAVASPSPWPLAMFCRVTAANASALGRAECVTIGRLLDRHRPPVARGQVGNVHRQHAAATAAVAARLAELPPERLPRKRKPLRMVDVEDRPAERSDRNWTNPPPRPYRG